MPSTFEAYNLKKWNSEDDEEASCSYDGENII